MKHVTFHLPSFLRRVRIHGGEFDSSARAMNRTEQVRLFQADPRIVRGSTIERKQMSTKTTFKRIALVTVAALGFGVMSVAPSNAIINSDSLTLSAATAAQTTAETYTATSATVTLNFLGGAGNDSMSVTASLTSGPSTSTALPYLRLIETTSAIVDSTTGVIGGIAAGTAIAPNAKTIVGNSVAGVAQVTAKYAVYLAKTNASTAPTVVGTYVVKLTPALNGGSTGGGNATAQTVTITVTTAPTLDTVVATATSILNKGETVTATADAVVTADKKASNVAAAATIVTSFKNAAGSAVTAESFTATISGVGTLGVGLLGTGQTSFDDSYTAIGRDITVRNGDRVLVFPDGTSGVGTITIKSKAGLTLATETVTFYGDVASIVATVVTSVIGVAAGGTGAVTAVAKDAAGTIVDAGTLYITSGTTTIISQSYASGSISSGKATFNLTGVKAGTAKITVSNGSTAALSTVSAAAVDVRVGGGQADLDGLLVGADKTSYAPGELVTLTVTPTDVTGLSLGNDTYTVFTSAGIVSSHTLTMVKGVLTLAGAHNGGVDGTGTVKNAAVYQFYAPNMEGDLTLSWTRSTSFATTANDSLAGSLVLPIASPGAAAATDAANEATDAANAATDAALAAAEAADAATIAAQEASDAVAALSESVTKLIAGLQAQIKSLAAVVAKIAKKVKA